MIRSIMVPRYRIRNTAVKAVIGHILHKQPEYYENILVIKSVKPDNKNYAYGRH